MPYKPRPSFNLFFESYLKGKTHFYGDCVEKVCTLIRESIKEKMEREPKGSVEMFQKHWNGLTEKEKQEYENKI